MTQPIQSNFSFISCETSLLLGGLAVVTAIALYSLRSSPQPASVTPDSPGPSPDRSKPKETAHTPDSEESDETLPIDWDTEKTIASIRKSSQKVGLILGRRRRQERPNIEGWQWVSLDRDDIRTDWGETSNEAMNRHWHLSCDFNDFR